MADIIRSDLGKAVFAILKPDEELMEGIKEVAEKSKIDFGVFSIIGTLKQSSFGFYSPSMRPVTIKEPLEILSCIGSVRKENGGFRVHAHMSISDSKFHSYGGHLLEGNIIDHVGELLLLGTTQPRET